MRLLLLAGALFASAAVAADLDILVVDPSGAPLGDARIALRRPAEPRRATAGLQMRTNARGEFHVPQPEPGPWVIDVYFPQRRSEVRYVEVSREFEAPVEEPLRIVVPVERRFRVAGVLVDTEGELAWGRYVVEAHPVEVDDPDSRTLAAPVSRTGGFALHGLAPGRYEIRVGRLDVARSAFGRAKRWLELEVTDDVDGLRISATGANMPLR